MDPQSTDSDDVNPVVLSRNAASDIAINFDYTAEDLETFSYYGDDSSQDSAIPVSMEIAVTYFKINYKFKFQASRHMTVNEFVRAALSEKGITETSRYSLLLNGRVHTSGTLQELNVGDGTEVCIVKDGEVSLKFRWCEHPDREHILPVCVMKTNTTLEMKQKLTEAFREFFPHYDLTNRNLVISKGHTLLNDVFRPIMGETVEKEDAEFTVHVVPSNEDWIPLKLKYKKENDEGYEEWTKELVFVPKNGTIGQMRDEIGKIVLAPSSSLKIAIHDQTSMHHYIDNLDFDYDSDDERMHLPYSATRRKFQVLSAPFKAKLSEYPDLLQDTCLLRVEQCPEISLTVKVTSDISDDITVHRLNMNRFEPLKKAVEKTIEAVQADPRQVQCPSFTMPEIAEKTVEDYKLKQGSTLEVKVLTKSALVTLRHCEGLFQDKKFFEDASRARIEELQRFVEMRHSFNPGTVLLYRGDNKLDSGSILKDIGVGMGAVLEVRTTPNRDSKCAARSSRDVTASESSVFPECQGAHQLPGLDAVMEDTVECEPSTCAEPMTL